MSLRFIIGEDSEKIAKISHEVIYQSAREDDSLAHLIIVPEQYTMQTQRALVNLSSGKSVMDVDILSFNRLAFRVFKELGSDTLSILEETGKSLILRRIAEGCEDELVFLKNKIKGIGYINEVKSLISELSQYGLYPDDIRRMKSIDGMNPMFAAKADDVILLYERFLEFLSKKDNTITAEMVLEKLVEEIPKSQLLKGASIVFDGFTGFTPMQVKVIEKLLPMVGDIYVTGVMPVDEWESIKALRYVSDVIESDLFYMTKTMFIELNNMAFSNGVRVEEPLFSKDEKNVPNNVKVYEVENPIDEVGLVGLEIKRFIRTGGLRYRDIAVIASDPNIYAPFIRDTFTRLDIPYFLDAKSGIGHIPAITFLYAILDVIIHDFSYLSVVALLKSGFLELEDDDICMMDNYLLASGIKGYSRYKRVFSVIPMGFDADDVVKINETREYIVKRIAPLTKDNDTVTDYIKSFFSVTDSFGLYEMLRKKSTSADARGDKVRAYEYTRVYDIYIDVLDKMHSLLSDTKVSIDEFKDLFSAAIDTSGIGMVSPTYDCVTIGDMERTRLDDIKVLFVIGANDGSFPPKNSSRGIFTESERERLRNADFELAPGIRKRAFIQRFYLYLMLNKPKDELIVSYTRRDLGSANTRPSYFVNDLLKSNAAFKLFEEVEYELKTECSEDAWKYLLKLLRRYVDGVSLSENESATLRQLLSFYKKSNPSAVTMAMSDVFYKHTDDVIRKSLLRSMDNGEIRLSVSRLEQYCQCTYAYYLKYILKLKERREHALASSDMGNLYHSGLEYYGLMLKEQGLSWRTIDDKLSDKILDEAIKKAYDELEKTEVFEKGSDRFVLENMKDTLSRTVWALKKQLKAGDFEPEGFEVSLSSLDAKEFFNYEIDEETRVHLSGMIDRIDTATDEKGNKIYVKIIDYKSGDKKLDYTKLYHGLQIQLIFYMDAVVSSYEYNHPDAEVIPAGAFYYHITDPIIEATALMSDEDIEKEIIKGLKPKGILADITEAYTKLDNKLLDGGSSDVIPIKLNKDGCVSLQSKQVESIEDINMLKHFVRKKVQSIAGKISEGSIAINPYRIAKGEDGCRFCGYHGICGFEPDLDGYEYNEMGKIEGMDDIREKLKEQNSGD